MLLAAMMAPGCVDLSRPGALNHEEDATDGAPVADVRPGDEAGPSGGDGGVADLAAPEADVAPLGPDAGLDDRGRVDAVAADAAPPDLAAAGGPLSTELALYLKLDEPSGIVALDSSGHGLQGLYTGADGTPGPATEVPVTMFPDPLSRAFTLSKRHAVQLAGIPAGVKQAPELTVSFWYRATTVDASGSELLSAGDSFFLRLRPGGGTIDFNRWIATSAGGGVTSTCRLNVAALDGRWHHVAAISTATSARAYFDGVEMCVIAAEGAIRYDRGLDLWVGRHGKGNVDFDFEGNIDEVRLYTRALWPAEVIALAQGRN